MKVLITVLNGIVMGIANIIPGVSGGTMAVALGFYEKMIGAINGLRKDFKGSLRFLAPLLLGAGIGIVAFSKLLEYLLDKQPLATGLTFIGLIFGGIPMLFSLMKKEQKGKDRKGFGAADVLVFVAMLALAVALPLMKSNDSETTVIALEAGNIIIMFVVGVIAAATMVIPGVSGSMVLMILGYYSGVLNLVNSCIDGLKAMDFDLLFHCAALLAPFGIGVLLGIVGIAKLISFLFARYPVTTYCGVFGLVFASPFGILYNTGVFTRALSVPALLIGLVLMVAAGIFTYAFSKFGEKAEA